MPRRSETDGKQKSVILNEIMEERLEKIKEYLGMSTDSEVIRYLINEYYLKLQKKR